MQIKIFECNFCRDSQNVGSKNFLTMQYDRKSNRTMLNVSVINNQLLLNVINPYLLDFINFDTKLIILLTFCNIWFLSQCLLPVVLDSHFYVISTSMES